MDEVYLKVGKNKNLGTNIIICYVKEKHDADAKSYKT